MLKNDEMRQFAVVAVLVLCVRGPLRVSAQEWKAQPAPRITGHLDMSELTGMGCRMLTEFSGPTDGGKWGVLATYQVTVPNFSRGLFFAHATKANAWPNMRNQAYPYLLTNTPESFANLRDGVVFFLLKPRSGGYLAVTALPGPETESWLHSDGQGRLLLSVGTFGMEVVKGCEVPLFAWARSDDPYRACHEAIRAAMTCKPIQGWTRLRGEKEYPDPLRYLGWCSWEYFKGRINEQNLLASVDAIEASGLPIRYLIVDMGHTSLNRGGLTTFKPMAQKFPHEWAPLLQRRRDDKIKWMGLWHFFQGGQEGISPQNDFGPEFQKLLVGVAGKNGLTTRDDPQAALAFYRAFMESVQQYGFDFVKVDFQSVQLARLAGGVPNAARMCVTNAQGFEQALHELQLGLINCNWHNPLNFFNCRYSDVGRCSMDYVANNAFSARRHLFQSYANTLWIGQLVWPDHDMFHSSDKMAARMMAVSKAMSGGPVYLSDNPTEFNPKVVLPLCYQDGELLRPLAPGAPLPDSLFVDAERESVPYRVIAPLPGRAVAIVAYTLKDEKQSVPVAVRTTPQDYACAGAMQQPYTGAWTLPAEGLVLYDTATGKGGKLQGEYSFTLSGLADRLVQLSPIVQNWSVIGRTDKYLCAAAVEMVSVTQNELRLRMVESGPLAIWSGRGTPRTEGLTWVAAGDGLYTADLPVGVRQREIVIRR